MSFAIIGSTEVIRDLLCGPQQHDRHCQNYRWHLLVKDDAKRMDNVWAELDKMRAERKKALRTY